jgi:hypothetical protein
LKYINLFKKIKNSGAEKGSILGKKEELRRNKKNAAGEKIKIINLSLRARPTTAAIGRRNPSRKKSQKIVFHNQLSNSAIGFSVFNHRLQTAGPVPRFLFTFYLN